MTSWGQLSFPLLVLASALCKYPKLKMAKKQKPLSPMALVRRLGANLHAIRTTKPPSAPYRVHHGYRKR